MAAPGFRYPGAADFWLAFNPEPPRHVPAAQIQASRANYIYQVVGKLKPTVPFAHAAAEMRALGDSLADGDLPVGADLVLALANLPIIFVLGNDCLDLFQGIEQIGTLIRCQPFDLVDTIEESENAVLGPMQAGELRFLKAHIFPGGHF